jgi:hypothetical protein
MYPVIPYNATNIRNTKNEIEKNKMKCSVRSTTLLHNILCQCSGNHEDSNVSDLRNKWPATNTQDSFYNNRKIKLNTLSVPIADSSYQPTAFWKSQQCS